MFALLLLRFPSLVRHRFVHRFLMENGSKIASTIDPRDDPVGHKSSKGLRPRSLEAVVEPTFFRASIFQYFQVPIRHHFRQVSAVLATSWRPGWSFWNPGNHFGVYFSWFFMFFGCLWGALEPFGDNFGAECHEKYIQKSNRKSRTNKYRKSCPKVPETMPKCIPNRIQKSCKIGTCDFCVFSESTT